MTSSEKAMAPKVTVLGAGITGLSSAVCIQQACPQAQVQVVGEKFTPNTTGDGSAGFWEPYLMSEGDEERTLKFAKETFDLLHGLALSPLSSVTKTQKCSGYHVFRDRKPELPVWKDIVEDLRPMNDRELQHFTNVTGGNFFTTVTVDVPFYMQWLMERFKRQGGLLKQAKVDNIEQLTGECDVLVNCSALSAKELFDDQTVFPIRGQVWKVHAPWIKHFNIVWALGDVATYVLPGVDYITIGGTAAKDNWSTELNAEDGTDIWNRVLSDFPWLSGMIPLKAWAGLRPGRPSLRLETETITAQGRDMKVVHNYGHGGSGVTIHWGCALEVTRMVLEALGTRPDLAKSLVSRL